MRRALSRQLLALVAGALLALDCAAADPLPKPVAAALRTAGIASDRVAIVVQAVDAGRPLLAHNAQTAMHPASTMKLLTTWAGLELLGPAHTWKTEALVDAAPANGRLPGNLYLRGSGDPKLTVEAFWLLLRQLRARGISDIAGDLVLDRSAFALPPHDPAAFDGRPLRPYNVGPDALLVNLDSIRLTLVADGERRAVQVIPETPDDGIAVANGLKFVDAACGDWRDQVQARNRADGIELVGHFPAGCGEKALHLSPWPADLQVERLFRALWRELGGTLAGQVRAGTTPPAARLVATQESPPLADIVRDINKYSNNVMARQLLLGLAAERPATPEAARRRVEDWLAAKGLQLPGLVIDNGSGLSRGERISAEGLARLLLAAWASPVMPEFASSLPVAGVDGTLRQRSSTVSGRAHLKTGSLDGVRALAGYVLDRNGRRWVTVILINDPRASHGKPAMDALLAWIGDGM